MKKQSISLSIPNPCTENWDAMSPADKGRFCASCQKMVVDFSVMTDVELVDYFKVKTHQKVCGSFTENQLKTIAIPQPRTAGYNWLRKVSAAMLVIQSFVMDAFAQESKEVKIVQMRYDPREVRPFVINGVVLDSATQKPISNLLITCKVADDIKITKANTAVTDTKGRFAVSVLCLPDDIVTVVASYRNYSDYNAGYVIRLKKVLMGKWTAERRLVMYRTLKRPGDNIVVEQPYKVPLIDRYSKDDRARTTGAVNAIVSPNNRSSDRMRETYWRLRMGWFKRNDGTSIEK